jgi:hypothetical protein
MNFDDVLPEPLVPLVEIGEGVAPVEGRRDAGN